MLWTGREGTKTGEFSKIVHRDDGREVFGGRGLRVRLWTRVDRLLAVLRREERLVGGEALQWVAGGEKNKPTSFEHVVEF